MKAFRFQIMVLVLLGFCLTMTHAMARSFDGDRRKMALVIGNKNYQHISSLDNPLNDAQDLAKILDNLGFEVDLQRNATHREMNVAIETFTHGLRVSKGIGLFFYAGHGVQVHNANYLLPVDVPRTKSPDSIQYDAVSADKVVAMMEDGRRAEDINIVILDACRNNPFKWSRSSKLSGLAPVETGGTVVAYAAGSGQEAFDGQGRNGVFTKYLKQHLATPRVAFYDLFRRVAQGVYTETKKRQRPWISGNFMTPFCFVSCPSGGGASPSKEQAALLLPVCREMLQNNYLTTPKTPPGSSPANALDCFRQVRTLDSANRAVVQGVAEIEKRYGKLAERALSLDRRDLAKRYIQKIREVNSESELAMTWEARLREPVDSRPEAVVVERSKPPPKRPQPIISHTGERYVDNRDGTITDYKTGLIGLKNADCFGERTWHNAIAAASNLSSGDCGLSDGSRPGDWRLPTKDELEILIDWHKSGAFSGVQTNFYWSSTAYAYYTPYAWGVFLSSGSVGGYGKADGLYVWPVRGGQ